MLLKTKDQMWEGILVPTTKDQVSFSPKTYVAYLFRRLWIWGHIGCTKIKMWEQSECPTLDQKWSITSSNNINIIVVFCIQLMTNILLVILFVSMLSYRQILYSKPEVTSPLPGPRATTSPQRFSVQSTSLISGY